ncbi:MAG TPA: NAD(P)-dependent oxidoreductase, partial [Dongiaceae bacterium]|nr:NAD(P)-dependent oxidoreductase [Dongiaceae bacterium]
MNYFPVFFDLRGRSALVVGGDEPAARRIRLLLKAGADVTVVAPRVNDEIAGLIDAGKVSAIRRGFVAGDVRDRVAVFAASGKTELDERVA